VTMRRSPKSANTPASRLPFLEGLRGIAALYVVLGHICFLADPAKLLGRAEKAPQWLQDLMRPFQFGHLAVASFIVLSGFCLELALFARGDGSLTSVKKFFQRRARRILPAYYACLAFSIWVCLNVTAHQPDLARFLPVTRDNVLAHIFLVHNFSETSMYKINGVLWSIALEAQLYILFPLLVLSLANFGRRITLAATITIALLIINYVPRAPKLYPWFLPLFVLGMVAAHIAFQPKPKMRIQPFAAWMTLGIGFLIVRYTVNHGDPLPAGDAGIGIVVASLCFLLTTAKPGLLTKTFGWKPLASLGGFSYSLYLMHHPILQIVYANRSVEGEWQILRYLMLTGLPIVLVSTYLFSLVFERPFISKHKPVSPVEEREPGWVPLSLPLRPHAGDEPPAADRTSQPFAGLEA